MSRNIVSIRCASLKIISSPRSATGGALSALALLFACSSAKVPSTDASSGGASSGGAESSGGTTASGGDTASSGGAATSGGGGNPGGECTDTAPPEASALVGWAAVAGNNVETTTGGGDLEPITVTTLAALNAAAAGAKAAVIYVKGVLEPGTLIVGSNKTIAGICGAELHGHVQISGASNVIIRNLKVVGYNCTDPVAVADKNCSSGPDAVTLGGASHHVWFDHCDISDGSDGNLDITQGSDFVTISWTKFHYSSLRADLGGTDSTGANGHRFSNLIGSADNVPEDVGHLNVTFHHDWWAENVNQRMPRTRNGKIHLFNNLFTSVGNSYCTNAGFQAALLVENSAYLGVKGPLQIEANSFGLISRGNIFMGTNGGTTVSSGAGFEPTYEYMAEPVEDVQAAVEAGAGPH